MSRFKKTTSKNSFHLGNQIKECKAEEEKEENKSNTDKLTPNNNAKMYFNQDSLEELFHLMSKNDDGLFRKHNLISLHILHFVLIRFTTASIPVQGEIIKWIEYK